MLGLVLAAAGAALLVTLADLGRAPVVPMDPRLAAVALCLAFVVVEMLVINLPFGRQSLSFSLSEVPVVVGLYITGPWVLLGVRLVGTAVALATNRLAPLKLLYNLCQIVLQTAAAVVVWDLVTAGGAPMGPAGWLGALLAAAAADFAASASVALAMRVYENTPVRRTLQSMLTSGTGAALVNASFGLVVVTVLFVDWRGVWMLGVFIGVLFAARHAHSALRRRHDWLERLTEFTGSVSTELEVEAVVETMLARLRDQLNADIAEVTVHSAEGLTRRWRSGGPDDAEMNLTGAVEPFTQSGTLIAPRNTKDPLLRHILGVCSVDDLIAAPLATESGSRGLIVVANRVDNVETFSGEDVQVLQALANHASVALANADLADRLRAQVTENQHQALHDSLTGLANRRLFVNNVEAATGGIAVVLLDLDRFKEINDTLGHATGDAVLQLVGQRLERSLPDSRCVARLGGDEFAIAFSAPDEATAVSRAQTLRSVFEAPFAVPDMTIGIDASIGVAFTHAAADAARLLQQADMAMYVAKAGRTGVEVYVPEHDQSSMERLTLLTELRTAIAEGALAVQYQPKVDVAAGVVTGAEALVRWPHPRRGMVPPDEFVPLAEHAGLIQALTEFVLADALRQCRAWRDAGHHLTVAVNLSPRSLLDEGLPAKVATALATAGLPAEALTLEITENTIMAEPERTGRVLQRLADMGIGLSVDDLGTGYSSLSYLKRLPVDEVKIDKSFVLGMGDDADDAAIVEAIVGLGHRLGKRVVAEGVEDERTYERLRRMGCNLAQGYWLSRPIAAADIPHVVDGLHQRPAVAAGGRASLSVVS